MCMKPGVVMLNEHILRVLRTSREYLGLGEARETLKLHNEEVCDMYSLRNILVIKNAIGWVHNTYPA
jgi:hypothetical protein